MFSGHTRDLPYIRNYDEAKAWWDKTPHNPRSSKWRTNQRPLRNISQTHYRLEADNPDEYIDVKLYTTTMARYYKPDANGHERRLLMGHSTLTSKKFMRDVLGVDGPTNTARVAGGGHVYAPVYEARLMREDHLRMPCSADFWYDVNHGHNLLIPEKSRHTRHWQIVSTAEDRERLKAVRQAWSPYLDLMMYRLPEFENEVELNYKAGRPFGASFVPYKDACEIVDMNANLLNGHLPSQEMVEALVRLAQTMFNSIASKRGYDQKGFALVNPWMSQRSDDYHKLEKPVTAHDLRKSLSNKLEQIVSAKQRSGYTEIPQFVEVGSMPPGDLIAHDQDPNE